MRRYLFLTLKAADYYDFLNNFKNYDKLFSFFRKNLFWYWPVCIPIPNLILTDILILILIDILIL